jgi:hypothetical protein
MGFCEIFNLNSLNLNAEQFVEDNRNPKKINAIQKNSVFEQIKVARDLMFDLLYFLLVRVLRPKFNIVAANFIDEITEFGICGEKLN